MKEVLKYGVSRSTGRTVHACEVAKGERCGCFCAGCEDDLIARQGEKNDWHFAHRGDADCLHAPESALHRLAKQLVTEGCGIRLNDGTWFAFDKAVAEFSQPGFRSDVCVSNADESIYIEIVVTSAITRDKQSLLTAHPHRTLVIDLSKIDRQIEEKSLRQIVIEGTTLKQLLFKSNRSTPPVSSLWPWLIGAALALLSWVLHNKRFNKVD